jgi:tRNA U34 5-methylaminomethyl-2-thiouridine-forming methyltransferase MnmC
MKKYQLIFHDDYITTPVMQLFTSEFEAENWANDQKSYSDDYDDVYYYNPEDGKSIYTSFTIEPIEVENLNEEFLRMQKLAGLITEEEYKSKSQELDLINLSDKITKKWDIIKQHIKNQGYDI